MQVMKKNCLNYYKEKESIMQGFALYVQKLRDSYIHPDYRSELNALNEWYTLEYIRLSDLGLLKEKQGRFG